MGSCSNAVRKQDYGARTAWEDIFTKYIRINKQTQFYEKINCRFVVSKFVKTIWWAHQ